MILESMFGFGLGAEGDLSLPLPPSRPFSKMCCASTETRHRWIRILLSKKGSKLNKQQGWSLHVLCKLQPVPQAFVGAGSKGQDLSAKTELSLQRAQLTIETVDH